MGSLEVETLEPASYYALRDELIARGFITTDGGRSWTGPIAEPLRAFTQSAVMTIHFQDGWPFCQPELEVPGMAPVEHVDDRGYVCLWMPGDSSQGWRTFGGWEARITTWCELQRQGFVAADATMDAHAYFGRDPAALAVLDLDQFEALRDGATRPAYGRWQKNQSVLAISSQKDTGGNVRGICFYRDAIPAPPTSFERLAELLTESQQQRWQDLLETVGRDKKRRRQFVLLVWGTTLRNALVVSVQQLAYGQLQAIALEVAPSDKETLLIRAGKNAAAMRDHRVAIFGLGSVGSQAALLLAESGLGGLTLIDKERLRPGNIVRHAAPSSAVGDSKIEAVAALIAQHAPWTKVARHMDSPMSPARIQALIDDHDLVVDATGNYGFGNQLAVLTALRHVPLVTAVLYHGGQLIRVQRQSEGDTPLLEREDTLRYPIIPPSDASQTVSLEAGCSAAVNLASPRSVAACAAVAADVAVDALSDRVLPDEIIDVLSPIGEPPFDRVCRLTSG